MDAQLDLIVKGGDVWTAAGVVRADVHVKDGKVAALVAPGSPEAEARALQTVDATGNLVLPGIIDTHTHHREPGFAHKEDVTTATRAAAAGGVTVSMSMPNVWPPTVTAERYAALLEEHQKKAVVDFNHHPSPARLEELPALTKLGALAFKVYMVADTKRDYPHIPEVGIHHHGRLLEIMEGVTATGRILMVHPHDQDLMDVIEKRYWDRDELDYQAYARAYREFGGITFDTAVYALLRLQAATACRLHVLHVSTEETLSLVRRAKAAGQRVTAEINPWGLFFGGPWEELDKLGPWGIGIWVLPEQLKAMWEGVRDGSIDVLGTDHAPHTKEEKEAGWRNMWKSPSGNPQIEHYVMAFLDKVNAGVAHIDDLVRVCCTNPARIFDLYPKKGVLQPGSDADMAIVDMDAPWRITNDNLYTKVGWTPYAGRTGKGKPIMTILRGRVIMKDGAVTGEPGYGQVVRPLR